MYILDFIIYVNVLSSRPQLANTQCPIWARRFQAVLMEVAT